MRGQICMYVIGAGYGFVAVGAKQIFFHAKNFEHGYQPVRGRWVEFEIGPGLPGKPPMAINVRYINHEKIDDQFQDFADRFSLSGKAVS